MYEIKELNKGEAPEKTMKYIESKRNWSVEKQAYKLSKEEEKKAYDANLSECDIYWRGDYLIVEYDGIIHFWDSFPYCFLKDAVHYMKLEKPAKWKTLGRLVSFRMGIRQTEVNCMGYVDNVLEEFDMSLRTYNYFMKLARKQDLQHHGAHTF